MLMMPLAIFAFAGFRDVFAAIIAMALRRH